MSTNNQRSSGHGCRECPDGLYCDLIITQSVHQLLSTKVLILTRCINTVYTISIAFPACLLKLYSPLPSAPLWLEKQYGLSR